MHNCWTRKRAFNFCSPSVVRRKHAAAVATAAAAGDRVYRQCDDQKLI